MSPKDEQTQTRRQQIIQAAIQLFSAQGFYKTTTAQVAQAVGVTQPYVFHFFKSKEELYLAVLEQAAIRILGTFRSVDTPADELTEAMGHSFLQLLENHREETLLVMQSYTIPEPGIREYVRLNFAKVYDAVKARYEEAGVPDPKVAASQLFGTGLVLILSRVLDLPQLFPWKADEK